MSDCNSGAAVREADELLRADDVPRRGRLLALDVGARRTGAAVCDELRLSVRSLPVLRRKKDVSAEIAAADTVERISKLAEQEEVKAVVVGFPLRADGSIGDAARAIAAFAARLSDATKLPIYLQDERYTSIEAETSLRDRGRRSSHERRELIDSEAAAIILRDFLSRISHSPQSFGDEPNLPEVF